MTEVTEGSGLYFSVTPEVTEGSVTEGSGLYFIALNQAFQRLGQFTFLDLFLDL